MSGTVDIDPVLVSKFKALQSTYKPVKQLELLNDIEIICYLDVKPSRVTTKKDSENQRLEDELKSLAMTSSQSLTDSSPAFAPTSVPASVQQPNETAQAVISLMNLTEQSISFGTQAFLSEMFTCFDLIESRVVLRKLALFWAKYMYYYHDYLIVFLSNHILLAAYFESMRRLLQRPNTLSTIELLCEPFLYFPTEGPIDLLHFLENSPVFNPMISPRGMDDNTSSTPAPLPTAGTRASIFSLQRTATLSTLSNSNVPSVVSPRASMSALFKGGATPGQKLNIFTLIGFPPLFEQDIEDYPAKVNIIYSAFKITLPHATIMQLMDDMSEFLEQYPLFSVPEEEITTQLASPVAKVDKKFFSKSKLPQHGGQPQQSPVAIDEAKLPWFQRKKAPKHGLQSVKEIAICKFTPTDTFLSDVKQPVITAFDFMTSLLNDFFSIESSKSNIGWERPTRQNIVDSNHYYKPKENPLSILNMIEEVLLHKFCYLALQIYFHPRARFISQTFFQSILTYINFPQLLMLLDRGLFTSYYPGHEYGITLVCQDIITVIDDNFILPIVEKENFIIALFQLSPLFQILWLYLMYASTIELISEDQRVKYVSRNDYYSFTKMMILTFELLSPSPSQGFLFMQYFASIAMFRCAKWIDVLIIAEIQAHTRQFIRYATPVLTHTSNGTSSNIIHSNYALKSNSITCLFTYIYDWLYTFSTLGTYKTTRNSNKAPVPYPKEILSQMSDEYKNYFLQVDINAPLFKPGYFLEPWASISNNNNNNTTTPTNNTNTEENKASKQTTTSTPESTPAQSPLQSRTNSTNQLLSRTQSQFQKGVDILYKQALVNKTNYINLITSRTWVPLDLNTISSLPEKQRETMKQWASRMLRTSTMSNPTELSSSIFKLFAAVDQSYKKIVNFSISTPQQHSQSNENSLNSSTSPSPTIDSFENPIGQCYPLSHFPIASDEQLAAILENTMKGFIGGLLLGSDVLLQSDQELA